MLRLREMRIEEEKTQHEMGKIFEISRQVYANYENGINEPSLDMLKKFANYFQCSTDYLLGREDDFGNVTIKKAPLELSTEEQTLLENYRSLPRQEKAQASEYVQFLASKRGNKNKNA